MEKLSHLIVDAVESNDWVPIKVGRNEQVITHLLFADDILLFSEASVPEMEKLIIILDVYCQASGHNINNSKTNVFFSPNVKQGLLDQTIQCSGFAQAPGLGKYLGSLPHQGKLKKGRFKGVIEKMTFELAGWKFLCLSMAGRVTLTQ